MLIPLEQQFTLPSDDSESELWLTWEKKKSPICFLIFKSTPGVDNQTTITTGDNHNSQTPPSCGFIAKKNKIIHFSRSFLLSNKASGGNS